MAWPRRRVKAAGANLPELSRLTDRLLFMILAPEVLYALGAFALVGGRICGGVQWHHWRRTQRTRRVSENREAHGLEAFEESKA